MYIRQNGRAQYDITFKGGLAILGRSHLLLHVCTISRINTYMFPTTLLCSSGGTEELSAGLCILCSRLSRSRIECFESDRAWLVLNIEMY